MSEKIPPPKSETLPLHRVKGDNLSQNSDSFRVMRSPRVTDAPLDPPSVTAQKNSLRIKSESFSLEFEGEADFIKSSYMLMRHHILSKLRDALINDAQQKARSVASRESTHGGFAWVYICHPLYHKVHVISRESLSVSPLCEVISQKHIHKIYAPRNSVKQLEVLIGSSKTLWSELTSEGRRRLKQANP